MPTSDATPPLIELRALLNLVKLAEHGSISAAAASLGLSQPSVSENVARLERRLAVQLAIRGPRGAVLTEAGLMLAREGKELIRSANALADAVRSFETRPTGRITVGLPPSLNVLLSVALAETVHIELPDVRLHVAEASSGHILGLVESGDYDLGCVFEPVSPALFETHPLLTEEIFFAAAPDNLPSGPGPIATDHFQPAELAALPLVLPAHPHGFRRIVERFAKESGITLDIITELDSLPQIVEMVSRASAYSLLPQSALTGSRPTGQLTLVPLDPPFFRTAYLVRKRASTASRSVLAIQDILLKITREVTKRYGFHQDSRTPMRG